MRITTILSALLTLPLAFGYGASAETDRDGDQRSRHGPFRFTNFGCYNLHLETSARYEPVRPGSDAPRGQAFFGLAADGVGEDPSDALFVGPSLLYGDTVVSNGRTCFTCLRGLEHNFGLPPPPLDASILPSDTLFTGIDADAGGDPDAEFNLNSLGLIKYRMNRFTPTYPEDGANRQVFAWRKSPKLLNIGLSRGFLTDGRGRNMFETARGAVFAHTQDTDNRFDDLPILQQQRVFDDMETFQFGIFSDPRLAALRDPDDPMHETLMNNPFYTLHRLEDLGRFRVPQLRDLKNNAPYFHDNSAATIEEALDHHLSDFYTDSPDGRRHPIRLRPRMKRDLLEFLRILKPAFLTRRTRIPIISAI